MTMTNEEIVREYRQAKTPVKQIRILADENQCDKKEILRILREAGVEIPAVFNSRPVPAPKGAEEAADDPGMPAADSGEDFGKAAEAAIEAIARMMNLSDEANDRENSAWEFRERVRGILAMTYELRKR